MTTVFSRASRRLVVLVTTLVAASTALVGSGLGSASQAVAPAAAAEGDAAWTLMIYDVADTDNIADDMIRNLASFAALPPMPNVNIVALVDLPEQNEPDYPSATLPGVAPFSTAKLLVLDGNRWNEIRDLGEISMGRPDVLASFIDEAAGRFPASKYGLVLSDHGAGAAGGYVDSGPPGSSRFSVSSMRDGIASGMAQAGIDRFELLVHDACLMANYEATSALAPLAETISASEEATFGWATLSNEAITALGQDVSGEEWGRINNEAYGAWADQAPNGWGTFTATAVLDGDQVAQLDAAVESFAAVATANMAEIAPEVGRARTAALEFVRDIDPSAGAFDLVDLGDFLRHLQDVPDEVAVARDAVYAALDNVVVSQVTRQATQQATGLNVYFPKYTTYAAQYVENQIGPSGWSDFVGAYLEVTGDATGDDDNSAQFTNPQATILQQGPEGILAAGQLRDGDSENVTGVETQLYTDLGGVQALAMVLPGYLDAGSVGQVQGAWSYQVTAIGNGGGGTGLPVSSFYQAQAGGLIGTFYGSYQSAAGQVTDVQFRLLLSSEGEVTGVSVTEAGGSAPVDLAGGQLTPYYIVPGSDGFSLQLADQSVQVTENFQISFPRLREGTPFEMALVVTDVAGGADGASVSSTVQGAGGARTSTLRVID